MIEKGVKSFAIAVKPHLVLLEKAWFQEHMRPLLGRWLLIWLRDHGLTENVITDEAILGVILDYEITHELQQRVGPRAMQLLNLSHTWLDVLLSHCLRKVSRVHFGLCWFYFRDDLHSSHRLLVQRSGQE